MTKTQTSQAAAILAKAKAAAAAKPKEPSTTITSPRNPREVRHAPLTGPELKAGRLQPRHIGRVSVT